MEQITLRRATLEDLDQLVQIEEGSFDSDRLSRRSLKHWIGAAHGILLVAESVQEILGYGLVWFHRGTRLARLYSLAVSPAARGRGIASRLLESLESEAAQQKRIFMRLEVAKPNQSAIALYERSGYRVFGEYSDYYHDHSDALRMQKKILNIPVEQIARKTPWYQQTTEFTCGPASLMMAMASLDSRITPDQEMELDIWREATTIFMTSGHGGCHPLGLALAAHRRGFDARVTINNEHPLFIEGVRSEHKKEIMTLVHNQFVQKAKEAGIDVHYSDPGQEEIAGWLQNGSAVIMLISTYRLDGRKAPHWVTVTSIDDRCLYVHDPDPGEGEQLAIDCQYLPISRSDFDSMSLFGSGRLRTAVVITQRK